MYDNSLVERELAVNDVAMFLKRKLDSGYLDKENEIKLLLGNVENMVSFFASQQRCNLLQNISLRKLLTNHSELYKESMAYYNERVIYWIKKSN